MQERMRSKGGDIVVTVWYARVFAYIVGGLTLLYQVLEVSSGNLTNRFLVADIILGVGLIAAAVVPARLAASLAMLAGYSYAAGVFVSATTGGLLQAEYDLGAASTTVGLVPCVVFIVLLGRWLKGFSRQA